MLKLALLTLSLLAFAMVLLCVRILFLRNGRFSSKHIGASKEMKRRGIHCVQSMDAMERRDNPHRVTERRGRHNAD